jgi:hypothetical protein
LFELAALQPALAMWKAKYCEGEFGRCERLRRFVRGEEVPPNMLPNGKVLRLCQ